jgi:hypothetical protein
VSPLEAKIKKNKKIDSESACIEDTASLHEIKIGRLQVKLWQKTLKFTSAALFFNYFAGDVWVD